MGPRGACALRGLFCWEANDLVPGRAESKSRDLGSDRGYRVAALVHGWRAIVGFEVVLSSEILRFAQDDNGFRSGTKIF